MLSACSSMIYFILNVSSLLLSSDEENTAVQISVATGQALRSVFAF